MDVWVCVWMAGSVCGWLGLCVDGWVCVCIVADELVWLRMCVHGLFCGCMVAYVFRCLCIGLRISVCTSVFLASLSVLLGVQSFGIPFYCSPLLSY